MIGVGEHESVLVNKFIRIADRYLANFDAQDFRVKILRHPEKGQLNPKTSEMSYDEFIDKLTYHHTSGEIGVLKENDTFTIEVVQNSLKRKKRSGKLDINVNIQPIDNSPPVLSKDTRNELYAWIGEATIKR